MRDEEWEELETRVISTIHFSLAPEIKYSVLNEKSPCDLWKKLEKKKIICQNPLHRLYLKKQLFELKMNEGIDVSDHITKFNKCVTQLLSVKIKINKENQIIILLASLPKSYEAIILRS